MSVTSAENGVIEFCIGSTRLIIPAGQTLDALLNDASLFANTANGLAEKAAVDDADVNNRTGTLPLFAATYLMDLSEACIQAAMYADPAATEEAK